MFSLSIFLSLFLSLFLLFWEIGRENINKLRENWLLKRHSVHPFLEGALKLKKPMHSLNPKKAKVNK